MIQLIDPEYYIYIVLVLFAIYALMFYFFIFRRHRRLVKSWDYILTPERDYEIRKSLAPYWNILQGYIIACLILSLIFMNLPSALLITLCCQMEQFLFRSSM